MDWIDIAAPGRLAIAPAPPSGDGLALAVRTWRAAGVDRVISLLEADEARSLSLQSEHRLCAAEGLRFDNVPIADHGVPRSAEAFRPFVMACAADVSTGRSLLVHCWAGIGRSSVLAACVMTALGQAPEQAFRRISAARGCVTPETRAQRTWVLAFARG